MRIPLAVLLAATLSATCGSSSSTAPEDGLLVLETVVKSSHSGLSEALRTKVASFEDWADTWQRIHAGIQPQPELPAIDFEREVVIVAASGTRPNGCYAITIAGATRRPGGGPIFDVAETRPGPNCVCTEALTQPIHAVRVARFPGPATFTVRTITQGC